MCGQGPFDLHALPEDGAGGDPAVDPAAVVADLEAASLDGFVLKKAVQKVEESIEQQEYDLDPDSPSYDVRSKGLGIEKEYLDKLKDKINKYIEYW